LDDILKAIVLGVVEGVTEFLPISSTGHLLVAARLLNFTRDANGTFEIFIQFGAVVALFAYYLRDLLEQAQDVLSGKGNGRRFWLCILLAFIPAAVIGLLLRNWIKTVLFASPGLIAASFIVGGVIFILVERLFAARPVVALSKEEDVALQVTIPRAFAIGCAQVLALVPGVSRSGASIVGGMLAGLDRATATRFSFYLAIPTLGSATLFELATSLRHISSGDVSLLAIGTVVAGIVAFVSIGWLLRYVQHHSFVAFGFYRIAAGLLVLLLLQLGML
jgi:undecaprenyl-diphosphatase